MTEEEAQEIIEQQKWFYAHLLSYIATLLCLVLINLSTFLTGEDESIWFVYPMGAWGPFVLLHGCGVFGFLVHLKGWEARKMQELTGWSATQDEIAQLSSRIETLLTIMAGTNLESFDSNLASSELALFNAKKIIEDQQHNKPTDKEVIIKLIEKLEAIVTSNEYQFFDKSLSANKSK